MSDQPLLKGPEASAPPQYQPQPASYPPPQAQGYPPPQQQPGYPPPQQGYQQQQGGYQNAPPPVSVPPQQTTVVVNNQVAFGENPIQMRCPNCHKDVITRTSHEAGMLTWLAVGVMFILGFWLCCWIPLIIDALKDVYHHCPNCNYVCGVSKKL